MYNNIVHQIAINNNMSNSKKREFREERLLIAFYTLCRKTKHHNQLYHIVYEFKNWHTEIMNNKVIITKEPLGIFICV